MLASCDENDTECRQDVRKNLGVALVVVNHDSTDPEILVESALVADSMTVRGLGKDSLLFNTPRSEFSVPVNKGDTVSFYEIYLRYDDDAHDRHIEATDTFFITYDNSEKFVSLECGCYISHNIHTTGVSPHNIDSIHLLNQQITNADETHIKLFVH